MEGTVECEKQKMPIFNCGGSSFAAADAFSAALPEPQRGPGVSLPLGGFAPVVGNGQAILLNTAQGNRVLGTHEYGNFVPTCITDVSQNLPAGSAMDTVNNGAAALDKSVGLATENSGIIADLSTATAATINSIRQAFQLIWMTPFSRRPRLLSGRTVRR